jgi:hypothetical protein
MRMPFVTERLRPFQSALIRYEMRHQFASVSYNTLLFVLVRFSSEYDARMRLWIVRYANYLTGELLLANDCASKRT